MKMKHAGDVIKSRRENVKVSMEVLGGKVGCTKATISNIEKKESVAKSEFELIAKLLHVLQIEQSEVLDFGDLKQLGSKPVKYTPRLIPILDYVQAGVPLKFFNEYMPDSESNGFPIDRELAASLSPVGFVVEVTGSSMSPTYQEGERVIVDPDQSCNPGDIVLAKIDSSEMATLKKYRPRGTDEDGSPIIELLPENEDHPTLLINSKQKGKIIGPVVCHYRKPQR